MTANDAVILIVVHLDTVTAVILGSFTGHPRGCQRCAFIARAPVELGYADTDRDLQRLVALEVAQRSGLLAHLVRELDATIRVRMRQEDAEVVACEPRQHGTARQILLEQSRKTHYDFVAGLAAERVVDELQIIEIKVDQLVRVVIGFQVLPGFV